MDPKIKLEVMIDHYRFHMKNAKRQSYKDSECGYHQSSQFNKGQVFILECVLKDLEQLLDLLKEA